MQDLTRELFEAKGYKAFIYTPVPDLAVRAVVAVQLVLAVAGLYHLIIVSVVVPVLFHCLVV